MSEMNKTVPRSTMLYWREKSQMQKSQIKVLQEILGDLLSWAAELAGDTTDEDQRDFEVSSVERALAVLSALHPRVAITHEPTAFEMFPPDDEYNWGDT